VTVRKVLANAAILLAGGVDPDAADVGLGERFNPRLDASLLLAKTLGLARHRLLASLSDQVTAADATVFDALLSRRLAGESVAYILGSREFYGRPFLVDHRVLVPRPETELLVALALGFLDSFAAHYGGPLRCHDACTGSGCVGLTIACQRPGLSVSLSDLSAGALAVAAANIRALQADGELLGAVDCLESDLLAAVPGTYCLITANPPYVDSTTTDVIFSGGSVEPRLALDGGADGLRLYGDLAAQAYQRLVAGGALLVEIGEEQGAAVAALFRQAGFRDVGVKQDLADQDRVVIGYKHEAD